LQRSAADILAIGSDLIRAKALLGHGQFGVWLDTQFALSRRSAEQFMAASRRFGSKSEAVSHLPAGAVLELSAPSVSDEMVDRVLAGEVPASVSAIREQRGDTRREQRSFAVAGTFLDYLGRFDGTSEDVAAGVTAHVLRRWNDPEDRAWFAECMGTVAKMIGENMNTRLPVMERPRTTVRRLKARTV
jgi:Protein of unknown function (DUF3102)